MNNIYVLSGEETILKDVRVKEICSSLNGYEYKSIYIEPYRSEKYDYINNEINLFLNTYDFFSESKVLKIVLDKPEQIKPILSSINDIGSENILIIDLRCPEFLTRTLKVEYQGTVVNIEKFYKFKDYEKEKAFDYINDLFSKNGLTFASEEDEILSYDYIINNAQGSYSFIYNEANKVSLLEKDNITLEDITSIIGSLSNRNNYKTCDQIFQSNTLEELVSSLERNLKSTNRKSFNSLIFILINKIKDYILLNEGKRCINKANYYTLKKSKVVILNPNQLIAKLNKISIDIKHDSNLPTEEFIWLLIEHMIVNNE